MSALINLAYYVIEASDLDAWAKFAENIVGLEIASHDPSKALALRADEMRQRFLILPGDRDDVVAIGWSLASVADLEAYVERLRKRGVTVEQGDTDLAALRRVDRIFHCVDPSGLRHEFIASPHYAAVNQPFRSKRLLSRFTTGRFGIGHVVVVAKDLIASADFYINNLGLRVSDYVSEEMAPGLVLDVTFLHAAGGRHHSLAFAPGPPGKNVHHIMLEVESLHDVGMAYDRFVDAGIPIHSSIGYHGADGMVSFYGQTPSGFGLEFGWGAFIVDDATWQVKRYPNLSDWGHRPPQKATNPQGKQSS